MKQTRKANLSKPLLWLSTTLCCAAVAFSAGQFPQEAPGEKIVNSACTACHELRPIETQALDKEGWSKVVSSMVEKGAAVKTGDVQVLVNYLAAVYGPLPDGAGKQILLNICTQCHTLDRVKARGSSAEEWDELLMHMLNEGAPLSDAQYPVLLNYLARNFQP
jgi:cytochrome c5